MTFTATFVNATGSPQSYTWIILLFYTDTGKGFGESPKNGITVPPGVSQMSVTFPAVKGPGGCVGLFAQAAEHQSASEKIKFPGSDGQPVAAYFDVCP